MFTYFFEIVLLYGIAVLIRTIQPSSTEFYTVACYFSYICLFNPPVALRAEPFLPVAVGNDPKFPRDPPGQP